MKHAEVKQSNFVEGACRQEQDTDTRRVWGLITQEMNNYYYCQLCWVFASVHGSSLEYSRQYNVAPQPNINVFSVQ